MTEDKQPYLINALRNGLDVIDCFARKPTWTLSELGAELSLNKPTLFRVLYTLEHAGYVTKDEDSMRYRLGMRLYSLGGVALQYEQLRWQALAPLTELARLTGETVYVGILYDGDAVCVQLVDGTHVVRMHSFIGKRSPAHASTLGKVLLAYQPDQAVEAYAGQYGLKSFTPNTMSTLPQLREELQRIRAQGYGIDNEEMEIGLRCVGAPITHPSGAPFATVAISGPSTRMTLERIESLVPALKSTALQISRMLSSPGLHGEALVAAA